MQPTPLVCPHCGGSDLARDPEHPHEYVCAHCQTRSRMLPQQGKLLLLGWTCHECGHDNERGNRFCTQCGTPLTKTCPNCGAAMRLDDKFCNGCGKTRNQIIAEWYRAGKGALDAGKPWEALPPLQRLATLAPDYGDVRQLLERATRAAATPATPTTTTPLDAPSPAAIAVRDAVTNLKQGRNRGQAVLRFAVFAIATLLVMVMVSMLVGTLLHSTAFGVLFFLFICALIGANVWIALHNL